MPRLARSCRARFAAALLVTAAACGGSAGAPGPGQGADLTPAPPHPDGGGVCAAETTADHYTPGMAKTGATGVQARLVSTDPVLALTRDYHWSVQLLDKNSAPLDGAMLTVTPYMPEHHHGTSITPTVTGQQNGAYAVDHVYLFMAGLWQITLAVQPKSGSSDSLVFNFCVED